MSDKTVSRQLPTQSSTDSGATVSPECREYYYYILRSQYITGIGEEITVYGPGRKQH